MADQSSFTLAGSFGHITSAATVAASSFSMTLTDPQKFLAKVDSNHFHSLLGKTSNIQEQTLAPAAVKSVKTPIRYVEPHLTPLNALQDADVPVKIRTTEARPRTVLRSRIYALGDFVDTDAVSTRNSV